MSAADESRARAQRLRRVLDECEAILADQDADPERRETAARWHERLGGLGPLSENYPHGAVGMVGHQSHRTSGGLFLNAQAVYEGWGDR